MPFKNAYILETHNYELKHQTLVKKNCTFLIVTHE